MAKKPPKYFTYHEYDELKKSFVYVPRDTIDVSFANYLISRITNTHEKELLLHDTFYQLKKLVERHHSFVEYGIEYCCYYINYWLNKTVRDSKYGINEHNFKYFDEFMKIDPNIRDNSINCISKLRYIDADTFQKMEKLYDLYDYFTKLKESEVPTTLCHNISDLAKRYESMMQEYERDNVLCKELTNLKNVIEKDKLVAKDICTKNTFDSFILIKHPPPRKEPTPPKEVQGRKYGITHTRPIVSASSPQAHGRHPGEKPTSPPVTVSSSPALDRNSRATTTLPPVTVSSSPAQVLEKQARVESERTSSVPLARFPLPLPVPSLESSETEGTEETDKYSGPMGPYRTSGPEPEPELELELPQEQGRRIDTLTDSYYFREDEGYQPAGSMQSTFDTGTIMGTIKDVVSNVLEAVEPVPILGVSGGMGALYLLLK
ncbi:PIR protein, partial [Plasmodium vivax]